MSGSLFVAPIWPNRQPVDAWIAYVASVLTTGGLGVFVFKRWVATAFAKTLTEHKQSLKHGYDLSLATVKFEFAKQLSDHRAVNRTKEVSAERRVPVFDEMHKRLTNHKQALEHYTTLFQIVGNFDDSQERLAAVEKAANSLIDYFLEYRQYWAKWEEELKKILLKEIAIVVVEFRYKVVEPDDRDARSRTKNWERLHKKMMEATQHLDDTFGKFLREELGH